MRDSFIIYRSFYEAICDLDTESQAQVFKAICEYSLNFEEIELTGIAKTIFKLIKPQLDANNKRYENGKQPKFKQQISKTEAKEKQNISKIEANKNVNNNDNVNDNVNENKKEKEYKSELEKIFNEFLEMRKKIRKPATEKAIELLKNKIRKLSNSDEQLAIKIIEQSIMNSWQDVFELRQDFKKQIIEQKVITKRAL
jgi:hypothetical protein